jgi:hypothetical protein
MMDLYNQAEPKTWKTQNAKKPSNDDSMTVLNKKKRTPKKRAKLNETLRCKYCKRAISKGTSCAACRKHRKTLQKAINSKQPITDDADRARLRKFKVGDIGDWMPGRKPDPGKYNPDPQSASCVQEETPN